MSVWSRIKLIVSSNINSMIAKAEDPEKILEQLIVEMRKQFNEAKEQVASSIADEKRLERQYRNEAKSVGEWEQKAMLAVRAGNDELARKALQRKGEHDGRAAEFRGQWEQQKAAADSLRGALQQLNDKIEEARRKKNILIARAKRAEAQKKIHETMSGLGDSGAFDTFDRMANKVDELEAKAEASVEIAGQLAGDNLESEFKQLEAGQGADDELAALKAKMGLGVQAIEPPRLEAPKGEVDLEMERLKALVSGESLADEG